MQQSTDHVVVLADSLEVFHARVLREIQLLYNLLERVEVLFLLIGDNQISQNTIRYDVFTESTGQNGRLEQVDKLVHECKLAEEGEHFGE